MGGHLASPNTIKLSSAGACARLDYAVSAMQGWRETMEDAHICAIDIAPETCLFAVLDGHGGKEISTFVSRHLTEELLKNRHFAAEEFELALYETFLHMDSLMTKAEGLQELYKIQQDIPDCYSVSASALKEMENKAGSTACVALLHRNSLYVANAGDSRCVLARGGHALDMSTDHKTSVSTESARVKRAGGTVYLGRVNGQLALTRSMGDFSYKSNPLAPADEQIITAKPDVKVEKLTPKDQFLILGCDGIWDVLSSQECVDYVNKHLRAGTELRTLCEELCDYCLVERRGRQGSSDNMTVIVVRLQVSAVDEE